MCNDLVSIITPLYNSESFVAETIESVLAQTYSQWEMLIVDDCSTDQSVAIVQQYAKRDPRIKLIQLRTNSGPAVARNTGIRAAEGRYIIFLDSDDLWLAHLLETEVAYMREKDAGVVFASYERVSEDKTKNFGPFIAPSSVTHRDLLKTCSISCLTGMYDTAKVGKHYMADFYKREDYNLWLDILKKTPRAWAIREPLAVYRIRENSVSRNKLEVAYYQWRFYIKIEEMSLKRSLYYFAWYAYNAIKKYHL